jgi:hypothetical protein
VQTVHDVDNDGYLVPEELDAMLRAFVIGSAKLAAQACNVMEVEGAPCYLLRGIYNMQTPLRFKLGGRPILSAHLNVETARSERKRPEM